ncbi:DUF7169 domain-containing protein [Cryobacterium soli]|uniref:DUF7169 domain-containing protein n=1 Tax=Cryobacterium soli TaxID=2220095 RepID=UPI000E751068|nr:hypothetical protein [Cryobacterium soli]
MTTATPTTAAALEAHGAALVDLAKTLSTASAQQWEPPARVNPRNLDGESRPSGRISDPTANIALDERRLALRASIYGAESALAVAADTLASATSALRAALDAHTNGAMHLPLAA